MNLYEDYVFPVIDKAQKGDEIAFVSPSTFFGFYSYGAKNFEVMYQKLEAAKDRGVRLRLVVHIHERFSAIAGSSLLNILRDEDEIRTFPGNLHIYQLLWVNAEGAKGEYCTFNSATAKEQRMKSLDNVRPIPVGVLDRKEELKSKEEVEQKRGVFEQHWKMATRIRPSVILWDPATILSKRIIFQRLVYQAVFLTLGILFGCLLVLHAFPELEKPPMTALLENSVIAISLGFVSTWLANKFDNPK